MKNVNFHEVNKYHKSLELIKKYLLDKSNECEHDKINEAYNMLNDSIMKLYKKTHLGV